MNIFLFLKIIHQVFGYKRILNNQELIVLNNFYGQDVILNLDVKNYQVLINNYNEIDLTNLFLKPYQSVALYKKRSLVC